MTALSIASPFPIFTDVDGNPLEDGYIYVGTAGQDAENNPISIYWDAGLTVPVSQPVRTIGGYPVNNGTPSVIYVNSDYSIKIRNKNSSLVYQSLNATERISQVVITGGGGEARADIASASTLDLDSTTANYLRITGTTTITAVTLANGSEKIAVAGGAFQLTNSSSLILPGATNYVTAVGDILHFYGDPSNVVRVEITPCATAVPIVVSQAVAEAGTDTVPRLWTAERVAQAIATLANSNSSPIKRQTVINGPVDSNGAPNFGGSTGTTTVTVTGTLEFTSWNETLNHTWNVTNPSWTGLSTNGTMYLYCDETNGQIASTLAPSYIEGGSYSTTNGQFTCNIGEQIVKVGNGVTADQKYRVCVGQVTVSGGVVSAIVWYALNGRILVKQTTIAASTKYSLNHNLGCSSLSFFDYLYCKTTELGYSVGDLVAFSATNIASSSASSSGMTSISGNAIKIMFAYGSHYVADQSQPAAAAAIDFSKWGYAAIVERAW